MPEVIGGAFSFISKTGVTANVDTMGKPGGTLAGDLLIGHFQIDGTATVSAAPDGWTELRNDVAVFPDLQTWRQYTYYKIAGASEPSSYTWTLTSGVFRFATLLCYRGANPVATINAHDANVYADPAGVVVELPSITTTVNGCLLLGLTGFKKVDGAGSFTDPPPGYTHRMEGDYISVYEKWQVGAGATGDQAPTPQSLITPKLGVAAHVAIKPAGLIATGTPGNRNYCQSVDTQLN